MFEKTVLHALFRQAHGGFEVEYWDGAVEKYGDEPSQFRVIIRDARTVRRALRNPRIAVAQAYVENHVDVVGDLRDVVELGVRNAASLAPLNDKIPLKRLSRVFTRAQALRRDRANVQHHYDLGNDFYSLWLDPEMTYTCAYFKSEEDSLAQAQQQKIDLVLGKLRLTPGQQLLDVGCGWGSLVIRAAQRYGVNATGVTVSAAQQQYAQNRIAELGLEGRARVELMDYREIGKLGQQFDAIAAVGIIEHLGQANIPIFMRTVHGALKPSGLCLFHFLSRRREYTRPSWANTFIFPGGYIASLREVLHQAGELDFRTLDVQNLRAHYPITLDRWSQNFEANIEAVRAMYDEQFVRAFRLYLRGSAAFLAWGILEVHQVLCSSGHRADYPLAR